MAHEDSALLFASSDVANFRAAMKCMIGDSAPAEAKHTIRWRDLPGMPMCCPCACNAMMVERASRDDWMRALPVLASACVVPFAKMGAMMERRATRSKWVHPLHTSLRKQGLESIEQDVGFPDRLRYP